MGDSPLYTDEDAEVERDRLRCSSPDHAITQWTRPGLEPLATRLSATNERDACRDMTFQALEEFHASSQPCLVMSNVGVGRSFYAEAPGYSVEPWALAVDFLVVSWLGIFLIWSWPDHYNALAIPAVIRARAQLQEDLGEEWPGRVEAVFHFPREPTGVDRHIGVDEISGEPYELVFTAGRIDQVLAQWKPHMGAGIDPQWLRWLEQAGQPRWWELATTRKLPPMPEMPAAERR